MCFCPLPFLKAFEEKAECARGRRARLGRPPPCVRAPLAPTPSHTLGTHYQACARTFGTHHHARARLWHPPPCARARALGTHHRVRARAPLAPTIVRARAPLPPTAPGALHAFGTHCLARRRLALQEAPPGLDGVVWPPGWALRGKMNMRKKRNGTGDCLAWMSQSPEEVAKKTGDSPFWRERPPCACLGPRSLLKGSRNSGVLGQNYIFPIINQSIFHLYILAESRANYHPGVPCHPLPESHHI